MSSNATMTKLNPRVDDEELDLDTLQHVAGGASGLAQKIKSGLTGVENDLQTAVHSVSDAVAEPANPFHGHLPVVPPNHADPIAHQGPVSHGPVIPPDNPPVVGPVITHGPGIGVGPVVAPDHPVISPAPVGMPGHGSGLGPVIEHTPLGTVGTVVAHAENTVTSTVGTVVKGVESTVSTVASDVASGLHKLGL